MNGDVMTWPLKRVADVNAETLDETTDPDFRFRYIDISSVGEGGSIRDLEELRFEDAPSRARRIVRPGDIIVSTVRTYLRAIASVPESDRPMVASTGFATLRARGIDPRFLYWYTQSAPFVEEVVARSVGVSYPAVNPAEIGRIHIPTLSLAQQRRIADVLDRETARLDALGDAKRRLVRLLREKQDSERAQWVQALFAWHGAVPLRRLTDRIEQGWSPVADSEAADPGDWGILKTSAVTGGTFRPAENKRLPADLTPDARWVVRDGDLLVARGSGSLANVGRTVVARIGGRRLAIPDLIYRVVLRRGLPGFVAHVLSAPPLRALIEARVRTDAGQTLKIRGDDLAGLPIPRVEPHDQVEMVERLEEVLGTLSRSRDLLQSQLALLAERRQTIITTAVTGAGRVPAAEQPIGPRRKDIA